MLRVWTKCNAVIDRTYTSASSRRYNLTKTRHKENSNAALSNLRFSAIHKLHRQEMQKGERGFVAQLNVGLLEARSGNMMNNHFYVTARTFELKPAKVRK
jgi:hypothetical protein